MVAGATAVGAGRGTEVGVEVFVGVGGGGGEELQRHSCKSSSMFLLETWTPFPRKACRAPFAMSALVGALEFNEFSSESV